MIWCAVNDYPSGPCDACGEPVEAPADPAWIGSLIWALRHPDSDRALLAGRTLGRLRTRDAPALREAAGAGNDVYLRAEALRSLIAIERVEPLRPGWKRLAVSLPFLCEISPGGR